MNISTSTIVAAGAASFLAWRWLSSRNRIFELEKQLMHERSQRQHLQALQQRHMIRDAYDELRALEITKLGRPQISLGDRVIVNPGRRDHWLQGWECIDPDYFKVPEHGTVVDSIISDGYLHELCHERFVLRMSRENLSISGRYGELLDQLNNYLDEIRKEKETDCLVYWSHRVAFENPNIGIRYALPEPFIEKWDNRDNGGGI